MTEQEFLLCIETKDWDGEMNYAIDSGDPEHEWWHSDGCNGYKELGKELVVKGFTYEEALYFLSGCYGLAAGEYGN